MDANLDELRRALVQGCGLPGTGTPASRNDLVQELTRRVDGLLRHDGEKLMYYLYALDVSEDIVAQAFVQSTSSPARLIAEAILKREAERLHTRQQYSQRNPDRLVE